MEYPDPPDGHHEDVAPAKEEKQSDAKAAAERRRQKILNRGEDRLGRLTKTFRGEERAPRSQSSEGIQVAEHFTPASEVRHRRVADSITGDADVDDPPATSVGDLMGISPATTPTPATGQAPPDPFAEIMNMFGGQGMEEMMRMMGQGGLLGDLAGGAGGNATGMPGLNSGAGSGLAGLASMANLANAGNAGNGQAQDPMAMLQNMMMGGDPREKARLEKLRQYQQHEEGRARPWRRAGAVISVFLAIATLWMVCSSVNVVHVPLSTDPASTGRGVHDYTAARGVFTDDDEVGTYDSTIGRLRGLANGQTQVLDDLGMERWGYVSLLNLNLIL
jgi:hypothetical protein